ncbi:MAG TPA: nucleoside triphosphate pyrophosphohydrolase family protein [Candidatus Woesebacteria bacterium]|nr:nucleoside triphosphate pyrophosphohydrolase family protein [Candidatus Woesebacteria bacterium]HNS94364.1 nucleoside triphosphate pyrophosphohydrolase family protein [Candidatus Woesebacteria bacterium]
MQAHDYQKKAARTLVADPGFPLRGKDAMTVWNAMGLAGEAGEVSELVKKGIFHQHGIDSALLRKEIGDVLWYCAALCTTLGLSLDEIMQENIDKLAKRYPQGFSATDSKKRTDVKQTPSNH